jgi:AbiV family abortive infection protein
MSDIVIDGKSNYFSLNSNELDSGIELCVGKARRLICASKLLANHEEFLPYALGLYVLALEEYGKSRMLQKAKSSCGNLHLVPRKIFGFGDGKSHKKKINEAMKNLPTKTITLETDIELKQNPSDKTRTVSLKNDKITVSTGLNTSGNFSSTGDVDILEDTRWRSFYLDWDNEHLTILRDNIIREPDLILGQMPSQLTSQNDGNKNQVSSE